MSWIQIVVLCVTFSVLQDAQSKSLDLQEFLKGKINGMVSDCKIKNDEDVKPVWDGLVTIATSKVIDSLNEMLSKEKTPLPNFSDDKAVIEHFQRAGSLQAFEKDVAEVYSVLSAFCNDTTAAGIAPRFLTNLWMGAAGAAAAAWQVPVTAVDTFWNGMKQVMGGNSILTPPPNYNYY